MKLFHALLEDLFGKSQAGGTTMSLTISMASPTHCSSIRRYSTCGGDETRVLFKPPLPVTEALLHAGKYVEKGEFTHT